MNQKTIIEIVGAVPRLDYLRFDKPVNWQIKENEHWAVIGSNGAGKTLLIDILTQKYALREGKVVCKDGEGNNVRVSTVVKSVAFQDIYSIIDTQNSYYQQRWNKGLESEVPIVRDMVKDADQEWLNPLVEWFGISDLMEKEVNLLSSGELRKFLIVRSLLTRPEILVMDNPYIGLDAASRVVLNDLFARLARLDNLQIVLVLSNPNDIPEMITNVLPIKDKSLCAIIDRAEFLENKAFLKELFHSSEVKDIDTLKAKYDNDNLDYENAAILKNIHIKYGTRSILKDLNWEIKRGEKWALLGANGAGKSTLLSLICGDNPQAYANDITLFDRKRGSGESIWDIKKHIGYVIAHNRNIFSRTHKYNNLNILSHYIKSKSGMKLSHRSWEIRSPRGLRIIRIIWYVTLLSSFVKVYIFLLYQNLLPFHLSHHLQSLTRLNFR